MRLFFAFILFIAFLFVATIGRHYYVCQVKQLCDTSTPIEESNRLKTLQLKDGEDVILDGYDHFAFGQDSTNATIADLNSNNTVFLDTLAQILHADSTKSLTITGFYTTKEAGKAAQFFENYGLARADAIRKLLVDRGIDINRITLDHGISEDLQLQQPLYFELFEDALIAEYDKTAFTFTNMTFSDANFEYDSYEFKPGNACILYADSVKTYLDLNPDMKLTIVGHTDDKGKDNYNIKLGKKRAESAKEYFRELGVKSPIATMSEGEKSPIATNKTSKGRQKNRRVNFIIE